MSDQFVGLPAFPPDISCRCWILGGTVALWQLYTNQFEAQLQRPLLYKLLWIVQRRFAFLCVRMTAHGCNIPRFKFCAAETDVVFLYAQGINSGFVNNRFITAFSANWAAWFVSAITRWCLIVIAYGCLRA